MKTLFPYAAGLAPQQIAAPLISVSAITADRFNASPIVQSPSCPSNFNIVKGTSSISPSHLSLFITSLVFLKEGAGRDWQPVISSPCYNYL